MDFWRRKKSVIEEDESPPEVDQNKSESQTLVPQVNTANPPHKKLKIPLNRSTTDIKYIRNTIVFPCPICNELNTLELTDLDPITGGEMMCMSCQVVIHIPGGYSTHTELQKLKIYAGLPVAIRKFPLFYWNHPVIHELNEQGITGIIIQYGLWGFCQRCHHQFSAAVLMNLPQNTGEIVDYRSLSSEEMIEMKSLRAGNCPYCSHRTLLVIISDVPHYVISASENISHRWEED